MNFFNSFFSFFRRPLGLSVFLFSIYFPSFSDGLTQGQINRFNIESSKTSELLTASKELLKNQQYFDVIPFLEEVILRLRDDNALKASKTLAFSIFQLAECNMRLGDFDKAADGFKEYAELFPETELRDSALVSSAQCFNLIGNWDNSSHYASKALENPLLNDDLEREALRVLSESNFKLERWDETIVSLEKLFRIAKDEKDRSDSAVMLVNCFTKKESFHELFRFLPFCNSSARHSLSLNAALLEAGDIFYNQRDFVKAQLLYRQVIPKSKIKQYELNRLNEVMNKIQPYKPGSNITLSEHKKLRSELEDEVKKYKSILTSIESFFSYDVDLLFRLAQCSYDMDRNWIAYKIYQRVVDEFPENILADQALYSAFTTMLSENEWSIAKETANKYFNEYPDGKFLIDIKYNLMMLHMQLNEFDEAEKIGLKAINYNPNNRFCSNIYYILGYIAFSKENFNLSLSYFTKILADFPKIKNYEEIKYWKSMSLLFLSRFGESSQLFKESLDDKKFQESDFYDDALYRYAISLYGEGKYILSKEAFINFIKLAENNELISEAYAMLGDLSASEPNLSEALTFYDMAIKKGKNINQISYPLFQKVRVLELTDEYSKIIYEMENYLNSWGDKGFYVEAINWIGLSYKKIDEYPNALQTYLDGITKYGLYNNSDRIDVIVSNIITDYNSPNFVAYKKIIQDWVYESYLIEDNDITSVYFLTILNNIKDNDDKIPSITDISIIPKATPITLKYICADALLKKEYDLVYLAINRLNKIFYDSPLIIDISIIAINTYIEDKKYEEAIKLGTSILNKVNKNDINSGYINLRIADSLKFQEKFDEAISKYTSFLSNRNWRGSLTPEALYGAGMCYFNQNDFKNAYQFFQRIYVLYSSYLDWTAKSYLMSVYCLDALGSNGDDILKTYSEMASKSELVSFKEFNDLENFLKKEGILK